MKTTDILEEIRPTLKHECNLALLNYLANFKARRKVAIGGQQFMSFVSSSDRDAMFLPLGKHGALDILFRVPRLEFSVTSLKPRIFPELRSMQAVRLFSPQPMVTR